MKIVQINATASSGSTGKITLAVSKLLTEEGVENYIFYSLGESKAPNAIRFMNSTEGKIQALSSRVFGNYGFTSKKATKRVIKELD